MKNRGPMSEEQRRAMFARLRRGGGGGGASSSEDPTSGSSGGGSLQRLEPTEADRRNPSFSSWNNSYTLEGGSVSSADMDFLQFLPFTKGAQTFASNIVKPLGRVGEIIASWKTPIVSALTSLGIGKYRDKHPTMDPKTEKVLALAQQLSSYTAALTGIGAAKSNIADAFPGPVSASKSWLQQVGESVSRYGGELADKLPAAVRTPLAKVHSGYTTLADITGASLADLKNIPLIGQKLKKADSLRDAATAARTQADEISSAARDLKVIEQNKATDILHTSHKGSLADWESAQRMYGDGAAKWYAAERGQVASQQVAQQMREQAVQLEQMAAQVTRDAQMAALKGGLVVAGFTTKEISEEARIRDLQQQMEAAYASGDSFTLPAEEPRGPLGTAAAALIGTLGNPVEKQSRYGMDAYAAQVANYRAKYEAIGRAEASGELSSGEAEAARLDLATNEKPWNMAGKAAWTFAPASAAFVAWQAGNLADYFNHEVEVGKVTKVLDGDTIEVAGKKIRMLGVDTPESVHPDKPPEYLGPEASHYQKDKLTGKTVRLVRSPGVTTDKYGRDLAYVETLPGPLDSLFNIPGVGKWIPGADQNENMIEQGFGQPRYLELSGGHERQKDYDKAVERAKRAGAGVWSPEGLEKLDYHYQSYNERMGRPPPYEGSKLGNLLGSGLMLTGQSGALKELGPTGNAIAQAWNASLAVIGASDYNAKAASRTNAIVFRPPKGLKSGYEKRANDVITKRRRSHSTE